MPDDNTLTIADIKRRGMAAIEEGLRRGPIRLVERNKATAVVLSQEDYEQLLRRREAQRHGMTAMQWLVEHRSQGSLSKSEIDAALREDRAW